MFFLLQPVVCFLLQLINLYNWFTLFLIIALLAAASQRLEYVILEWFGNEWMHGILREWERKERGAFPGLVETAIIIYVQGDQPKKTYTKSPTIPF